MDPPVPLPRFCRKECSGRMPAVLWEPVNRQHLQHQAARNLVGPCGSGKEIFLRFPCAQQKTHGLRGFQFFLVCAGLVRQVDQDHQEQQHTKEAEQVADRVGGEELVHKDWFFEAWAKVLPQSGVAGTP